ncbi:MAG: hypothetical protein H0U49_04240 [Parachlamydiaceae bacterium]|nr:hypothetical protein [Parachlamydiaceae bacterium]
MHIGQEQVYFPCGAPSPSNSGSEKQMESFRDFIGFLNEGPQLDLNCEDSELTQDAIAFFLEATKQLNPKDWEEKVSDLKNRIREIRQSNTDAAEVFKETTWVLNNAITHLYQTSLAMKILDAEKKENYKSLNFFKQIFKCMESTRSLRKTMENRKRAISIGGINDSLLPSWYTKNFTKTNQI